MAEAELTQSWELAASSRSPMGVGAQELGLSSTAFSGYNQEAGSEVEQGPELMSIWDTGAAGKRLSQLSHCAGLHTSPPFPSPPPTPRKVFYGEKEL